MQRMIQACAYPVALIVAPAGYGKTVALRQYLDRLDSPHVRFDVRPEHETLPGFVRGLAEAAAALAPEMRSALGDALRGPTTAAQLAEWAATHLREFTGVVAIDDLHLAGGDDVPLFLRALMERLKGQVRWVFASRSTPDLPIASWVTYGEMDIPVDDHDLAFTVEEAEEAGTETGASEEELRRFIEMTGGWATALSFAMRSRVRTGELEAIGRATRDMVYRYLAEQVYEQLSDIERRLLHLVAYMPSVELDVLVIAGFADAYALLEKLRKRTAFLSAEGDRAYRCHDLFRDFVQHRVDLMGEGVVRNIRLCLASAFEKSARLGPALLLYSACRAWSDVVGILEQSGISMMDRGEGDVVRSVLSMLAGTQTVEAPPIMGLRAWVEYIDGRHDIAEGLFRSAIHRTTDGALKDELSLRLAQLLYNKGDEASELLEKLIGTAQSEDARIAALGWLAAMYARKGQFESAKQMVDAALHDVTHASRTTAARTYLRAGLARLEMESDRARVEPLFEQAHTIARASGLFSVSAAALSGLSNICLLYEDDVFSALHYAIEAQSMALLSGDRFHIELCALRVGHLSARIGDKPRLQQIIEDLKRFPSTNTHIQPFIDEMLETAAAWDGNFELAVKQATLPGHLVMDADRMFVGAQHALYLAAIGESERAASLAAEALRAICAGVFSVVHARRQAECARLVCAIVQTAANRRSAARRILRATPITDAPYLRVLARIGELYACADEPANKLHRAIIDELVDLRHKGRGGLSLVLEQFFQRVCGVSHSKHALLTPSELQILRKLDSGFAPKEIAAETGRSVHTVRTLVQRAVTKLGCNGRQEALAAARRAGLLEDRATPMTATR